MPFISSLSQSMISLQTVYKAFGLLLLLFVPCPFPFPFPFPSFSVPIPTRHKFQDYEGLLTKATLVSRFRFQLGKSAYSCVCGVIVCECVHVCVCVHVAYYTAKCRRSRLTPILVCGQVKFICPNIMNP